MLSPTVAEISDAVIGPMPGIVCQASRRFIVPRVIDYPRFERRDACGHHATMAVQLPECLPGSFRDGVVRIHQRYEILKLVDAFRNGEAELCRQATHGIRQHRLLLDEQ